MEPEPTRFSLAPQNGFSLLSPRDARFPAQPSLFMSLPALRWGGDPAASLSSHPKQRTALPAALQDPQLGPSTPCAKLSFAECSGSSDIVFVPIIQRGKLVHFGSNSSLAELETSTAGLCGPWDPSTGVSTSILAHQAGRAGSRWQEQGMHA